jgi:hypothetical protein
VCEVVSGVEGVATKGLRSCTFEGNKFEATVFKFSHRC